MGLKYLIILIFTVVASTSLAEPIVVIGDSLSCGPFGKYLVQNLSQGKNQVTLYCAVSSAPQNWLKGKSPSGQLCQTMTAAAPKLRPCGGDGKTPKLESILKAHPGARVVVGLGTNSLLDPKADASYRNMATLIKESGGQCDWIGPPHMQPSESRGFPSGRVATLEKNLNEFYTSLSTSMESRCNLLDSREATVAGSAGNETVDGVHRNDRAGKFWAEVLQKELLGGGDKIDETKEVIQ